MNKNKLEGHIQYLKVQHDDLDKQIQEEYKKYGDDSLVIYLKKQKLKIKDEVEKLTKKHND